MSRILVTGGAGFIGSHLCRSLHESGHEVTVVDSFETQVHGARQTDLGPPWEVMRGDCGEPKVLGLIERADKIVHLAAAVGVGQSMYQPALYVERNTLQTAEFLNMVRKGGSIERLVVASSMSIYGEGAYLCECRTGAHYVYPTTDNTRRFEMRCRRCGNEMRPMLIEEDIPLNPTSVYGITKRDQEELALVMGAAYGISTCALRFFNVYGEGQSLANPYTGAAAIFANRIMEGAAPIVFEDGKQSRDFIHVSDIVRGIEAALDSDYVGSVNLGTGERTSIYRLALALGELLPGIKGSIEVTGEFREGDIRHGAADVRLARRALGWKARVTLHDGMKRTTDWMSAQGGQGLVSEADTLRVQGLLG